MRARFLLVLVAAFLFVTGLQTIVWAELPGNILIIDKGPIVFTSEKRQHTIKFQVKESDFTGSKKFVLYVAVKAHNNKKFFNCNYGINGEALGGGGTGLPQWNIGGTPVAIGLLKIGTNEITIKVVPSKIADQPITYNGLAGGIVIYFPRTNDEESHLLSYINYAEPEMPSEVASPSKEINQKKAYCWVIGIVHIHDTNSDGSFSLGERFEQVKGLGYDYILAANHYEQIDQPTKAPGLYYGLATRMEILPSGFDQYVQSCKNATQDGCFVAIAGAEVSTPWHINGKTLSYAHTLCLGSIKKTADLDAAQGREGKQEEVIAAVNKIGLSVAAHPNLTSLASVSITPWEGTNFVYDLSSKSKYVGLNGVEIGNTVVPAQGDADINFFMKLMTEHQAVFPTGGCDSHGWGDSEDNARMKRITGVFVDELSERGILNGLKQGKVYAGIDGVKIVKCAPIPSFSPQFAKKAQFSFTLGNLPQRVMGQMYRNGELVQSSKKVISPDSPIYEWSDDSGAKGENWYNFRILPNYLVTAPIVLRIN